MVAGCHRGCHRGCHKGAIPMVCMLMDPPLHVAWSRPWRLGACLELRAPQQVYLSTIDHTLATGSMPMKYIETLL